MSFSFGSDWSIGLGAGPGIGGLVIGAGGFGIADKNGTIGYEAGVRCGYVRIGTCSAIGFYNKIGEI